MALCRSRTFRIYILWKMSPLPTGSGPQTGPDTSEEETQSDATAAKMGARAGIFR